MVQTTPQPQRTKQSTKSPYDSGSILIAIGKQRRKFNILESFLKEKTSFFDCHGPPILNEKDDSCSNRTSPSADIDHDMDPDLSPDIMAEEDSPNVPKIDEGTASHQNGKNVLHYHITTKIHTPQAFKTFVDWLHNILPSVPEDTRDCKFLLQAYVLAVKYDAAPLQNAIMDCFREYHTEVTVELDHLVWMINNTGDNTKLPMTAYLVQQIAYEVAIHGIEQYEKTNKFMPYYMEQGHRFVRYELVKAIAHRATASGRKAGNPATVDTSRWYVTE